MLHGWPAAKVYPTTYSACVQLLDVITGNQTYSFS